MTRTRLILRNLTHYWRTNLAVIAGVAAAVAVLAGALLVGDSVRASLRDMVMERLGRTSFVVTAENFFSEDLAGTLADDPVFRQAFDDAAGLIAIEGVLTDETSRRRASGVLVYGVDDRFWQFHGMPARPMEGRQALLSTPLAEELGSGTGDSILLRVEKPSAVPVDSLHSDKDDLGTTLRLNYGTSLTLDELGEFSLRPGQGAVRAVFVPLEELQNALDQTARVNSILVSEPRNAASVEADAEQLADRLEATIETAYTLDDLGVRLIETRTSGGAPFVSVESSHLVMNDGIAEATMAAGDRLGWDTRGVFTYLANTIRIGDREIPYSLTAALDGSEFAGGSPPGGTDPGGETPIWLNEWAWDDLGATSGDTVEVDYYVWFEGGRLEARTSSFVLRESVPMNGLGGDPQLAPTYPGISEADTLGEWNPPFPVDLTRIRDRDEDYWDAYRTAPKAFVPLEIGRRLWGTRYGSRTSIRLMTPDGEPIDNMIDSVRGALRDEIDPLAAGFQVVAVRAAGGQASGGAIDFSLYFISFSFFLVISALLLASLFFRLGIEQRLREIGLLEALGYSAADLGRLFLAEGAVLAGLGSLIGAVGAAAYSAVMVYGLGTWWVDAVGTSQLRLELSPLSLGAGVVGGMLTALACIRWTLRGLRTLSPRSLITGAPNLDASGRTRTRAWRLAAITTLLAFALLGLTALGWLADAAGFFGAGALLLTASLAAAWGWLGSERQSALLPERAGVVHMGIRNASWRPGRSLLSMAMVASAAFILVSVDAFRKDDSGDGLDLASGTGGFALLAESLLPIPHDLNTADGQASTTLTSGEIDELEGTDFFSFRLRAGEDVSCLNLYQPNNPRILGVPQALIETGRFLFGRSTIAEPEEGQSPWDLLNLEFEDGAVPAIADAHSLMYILKRSVGDDFVIEHEGRPVRLRIVAALSDSLFQSEMLISESNFLGLFPYEPGYRFFLIDPPGDTNTDVAVVLEDGLADAGFDVMSAAEKLAIFHRVENTYISTFQTLGGLGLLLGTLGLAAVMLRNVLERRREMALLRAAGYRGSDLAKLVLAENSVLLLGGLASGGLSAMLAISPALISRGLAPGASLVLILAAVVVVGLTASVVAVAAIVRAPVLAGLRSE